jgi:hypothetical protein
MLIACGILELYFLRIGGTSEWETPASVYLATDIDDSFLIKDAQEDMAGQRLKA